MEILGDFSFLSKCTLNINIQDSGISIKIVDIKDGDFEEIKQSFDKLKLMKSYSGFGVKFNTSTLTNIHLSKDIYSKHVSGRISLKPDS